MLSKFFRLGANKISETMTRYKRGVFNAPKKTTKEYLVKTHKDSMDRGTKSYVNEIKKMLETKTPKLMTTLIIASTFPTLYYLYSILGYEYEDPEFYNSIKKGIDWINYLNIFSCGIYLGLEAVKYSDRRAKARLVVTRNTPFYILGIVGVTLASLTFWDTTNKFILAPSVAGDLGLLLAETKLASDGLIPYWLFDVKYRTHLFTVINLAFYYYSLKHLTEDMKASPEKYPKKEIEQPKVSA